MSATFRLCVQCRQFLAPRPVLLDTSRPMARLCGPAAPAATLAAEACCVGSLWRSGSPWRTDFKLEEASMAYRLPVKEWPTSEQPREKLAHLGAEHVANHELLAILLRVGVAGQDVVSLSQELL